MNLASNTFLRSLVVFALLNAHGVSAETSAPKLRPANRLVFVAEGDPTCAAQLFETSSRRVRPLLVPKSCPKRLSAVPDRGSVFVIDDESIQEIDVDSGRVREPRRLPSITPKQAAAAATGKYTAERVETRSDGKLVLLMTAGTINDGTAFLRFVDRKGEWSLEKSAICVWSDFDCLAQFAPTRPVRREVDFFGEEKSTWHDRQLGNPFVVKRETSDSNDPKFEGMGPQTIELTLKFGGRRSILRFLTISGPDTGAILTMRVELEVDGGPATLLSGDQFYADLMGRFLLIQRFGRRGPELIDLETGKSRLGRLALAEWAY